MIIRSKAPLRIGLAGGGSDLLVYSKKYGGSVLNATIGLYAYCTIIERSDKKIFFEALDIDQSASLDSTTKLSIDGDLDLYKLIYNRIIKDYVKKPLSFSLSTYSDVSVGSGLGGSSTLIVAIIKAFVTWLKIPLDDYAIANLAYEVEREEAGIAGGLQDQYSSSFGGFNFIEFFQNGEVLVNSLKIKDQIISELELSSVLYYTNIQRHAGHIEREKSSLLSKKKSIVAMHKVKENSLSMKMNLLKGNLKELAKSLNASWDAKKEVMSSISNSEIDLVYDTAMINGAIGGKVSGAGGGGFMFFIVDPVDKYKLEFALNKMKGYTVRFSFCDSGAKGWIV